MADALRNVSGITLGGAEGGQIGSNVNLNGFSARTDIYLDGFRDRGQYFRDTFALDAIEVLMGPSSMLFGRGSTGGTLNQVTKKPFLKERTEIRTSITSNGLLRSTPACAWEGSGSRMRHNRITFRTVPRSTRRWNN